MHMKATNGKKIAKGHNSIKVLLNSLKIYSGDLLSPNQYTNYQDSNSNTL